MMKTKILPTLAACLLAVVSSYAQSKLDLSSGWTFDNGAEFPGATGSLEGTAEDGLRLEYDFSGGGVFVVANRTETIPAFTGLQIRAKGTGAQMGITIYDASDEVFVFENVAVAGDEEQTFAVDLTKPTTSWGGNGDKVIQFPLRGFRVMVYRKHSQTPKGTLEVKEILLKSE